MGKKNLTSLLGFLVASLLIASVVPISSAATAAEPATPPGITRYAPITITNPFSTSVPGPFQQQVQVDSATFAALEAPNLQNVEFFYANGTVIPSWLESGAASSSANTLYWLKLAGGVQADENTTIYMGFAAIGTDLFNPQTTGEAPQLSPVYGEYDDGGNVFDFYDNFVGTSLGSQWNATGVSPGSTVTVDDGLNLSTNSTVGISTTATHHYAMLEAYVANAPTEAALSLISDVDQPLGVTITSGYQGLFTEDLQCGYSSFHTEIVVYNSGSGTDLTKPTSCDGEETGILSLVWGATGLESLDHNYTQVDQASDHSVTYAVCANVCISPPLYSTILLSPALDPQQGVVSGSTKVSIGWIRERAFPPDGQMPAVSVGAAETITTTTTTTLPPISLSCSSAIVQVEASPTCTFSATGVNTPTGTVTFSVSSSDGAHASLSAESCTLVSGSCSVTVTGTVPGTVTITGSYSGDTNNPAGSGTFTMLIEPQLTVLNTETFEPSGQPAYTTIAGYTGIEVSYINSYVDSVQAVTFAVVQNSQGQTVAVGTGGLVIAAGATGTTFVVLPSGMASGTYSVKVFAVTLNDIAISTTGATAITVPGT